MQKGMLTERPPPGEMLLPSGTQGGKGLVCRVDPSAAGIKAFKSEEWECV